MNTTWVLIMLTGAYYGNNIAAVPGFATRDECILAAAAYETDAKKVAAMPTRTSAFCIPGPTVPRPTKGPA
jgi:hypothetical protein